jgi:hypothetical protein
LDDNFRRRAQEKKGQSPEQRFKQNQKKPRYPDEIDWTAFTAIKRNVNGKFQKQGPKRKGKCYNCGKEGHFATEYRSANKASFSEEPRKSKKNKGYRKKQRKEKIHELRGEEKERDESPGGNPVYFHLLKEEARSKSRKRPGPGNLTFSDPPPPFRITENLPETAQNLETPSEKRCTNPAHQVWEQAQAKLEADSKNTATQTEISELPTHFRNRITGKSPENSPYPEDD